MAKRKTTRSRRSSRKKKQSKGLLSGFAAFVVRFRKDAGLRARYRKLLAWSLIFLGLLAAIACVSHFRYGAPDQSIAEGGEGLARNWLGVFGAWTAHQLVHRGFGVFGIVVPLYLILLGMVLLENTFYTMARRLLKYALFLLFWGSLFLAFVVVLTGGFNYDLGGGVGHAMYDWFRSIMGPVGVAFVLLFALVAFAVVNFNAELRASHLLERLQAVGNSVRSSGSSNGSLKDRFQELMAQADADFDGNVDAAAKASAPAKSRNTRSKAKSKTRSTSPPAETPEPAAASSATPTPAAKTGEQIDLNLPQAANEPPKKLKVKTDDLEFTIEEPDDDDGPSTALSSEEEDQIKEYEQLGDDNVGVVKGQDRVEKIVEKEDQEIDLEDFEAFDPTKELSSYDQPPVPLLEEHGSGEGRAVNREELIENKNKIVETLKNYGIEITSIKATVGPTVTLYEIVPAPGVRISKIRNLEDDIALSLAALGIRIIAPIPGKGTIGIEVPNSNPEIVSLRSVISTKKFDESKAELPIALGRTIDNKVYLADLNKMPHLLIAGATGQGKSVGLNTIIASLLYKKHPAEIKFVLIDPKKVEMNLYTALQYHYLAQMPGQKEPIITDVREAVNVLKSLCIEMDQRYDLLKAARVRNLKEYNAKFLKRKLNPRKGHYYMPYIVLVIDELADMMMMAGKEVEMPIARLAQLARAIGIHLVVATQRPSVNVITGIIKANFPARMSYRVISKVDSRTILDANGADQLIGRGDMLLSTGSDIVRLQNAFIDTKEVERLVDFIAEQRGFPEPYILPEVLGDDDDGPAADEPLELDEIFPEAAQLVVKFQMGSASLIQRKMKIGYNRAGRIIDQLERAGIVGPHKGSKAREVLIQDEVMLNEILAGLKG